jgi:hypothetical protein
MHATQEIVTRQAKGQVLIKVELIGDINVLLWLQWHQRKVVVWL